MSTRINLCQLVPFYVEAPNPRGIFTKAWAVRVLVRGRLNAANGDGKGAKAQRRIERLRVQFEREADEATREWYDNNQLSAADIEQLADEHASKRHFGARPVTCDDQSTP